MNNFAAGMLAAFGMLNAIIIVVAAAMWASALNIALSGDSATMVYNMFGIHESLWLVGNLFFGLWLIPMGYLAGKTAMPQALTWFLMIGGVGYILSAFIFILFPGLTTLGDLITIPATVGEFWMIGYLLIKSQLQKMSH